ncbi:MAG: hypothetical protein Q8L85_06205 [Alphaproteobacteria bacterium]|nr:hypothetical protein [Alphaproteobacteria bacterium]
MKNFVSFVTLSLFISCSTHAMENDQSTLEDGELAYLLSIPDEDTQPEISSANNTTISAESDRSTIEDTELAPLLSIPDVDTQPENNSTISAEIESPDTSNDVLIAQILVEPPLYQKPIQEIHPIDLPNEYIPIWIRLEDKMMMLISNEQMLLITQFKEIDQKLRSIPNNSNVHVLDAYIFGAENKIQDLANIGAALDIDNPHHSLQEIGIQMINFIDQHADLFVGYQYEKDIVSTDSLKAYLHAHFNQMDQEIAAKNCPNAQIIWSRAFSLALELFIHENDFDALKMLYDAAIEGHLTKGGCLAGRINRGFVLYVSLLGKNGFGNIYS